MKKEFAVKRYNLMKEFISEGVLTIESEGPSTSLTYTDSITQETATELYHPTAALETLRNNLETKYKSILGCNGCRIDTSYRHTGGWGTYINAQGQQATESLNIFEPTEEISKLCTVKEHQAAYEMWLKSLKKTI
ncbi:MAG: hypothetical protein ABIP30_07680 [Ferruginibacter sp.]